jgi:RNA polymerase sigma factor (sigma-70 family)
MEIPSSFEKLSDEDLCLACTRRPPDEAAWQTFYDRFLPLVSNRVRHGLGLNAADVQDVVQEAFLRIFSKLHTFDPARASFKTYLSRVVANLVIDHLRHGSELRAHSFSLEAEIDILQIQATQDPEILHRASARIVDRVRKASEIATVRDLLNGTEVKDISSKYGLSTSAVYEMRGWVVQQLREVSSEIPDY